MYLQVYEYLYIFSICICLCVIITYLVVDCYMNTIGDMQNEKHFYGHCNEFEYIHDFLKFF